MYNNINKYKFEATQNFFNIHTIYVSFGDFFHISLEYRRFHVSHAKHG